MDKNISPKRLPLILLSCWVLCFLVLFFRPWLLKPDQGNHNFIVNLINGGGGFIFLSVLLIGGAACAAAFYLKKTYARFTKPKEKRLLSIALTATAVVIIYPVFGIPVRMYGGYLLAAVWVLICFMTAGGIGDLILDKVFRLPSEKRYVPAAMGIGIAGYSLGIFMLSLLGLLKSWLSIALIIVIGGIVWKRIGLQAGKLRNAFSAGTAWYYPLIIAGLILVLICALQVVPPLDYDVLEYHLGAPAHYNDAGRFYPVPGNVYAAFPSNGEMLYLLGLTVGGRGVWGWLIAKLFNAGIGLLLCGAVYSAAARRSSPAGGWAAALIMAAAPWFHVLSMKPYIGLYVALFTVLTVDYLLQAAFSEGKIAAAGLAGFYAGAAGGAKYTAFLFAGIAGGLWLIGCLAAAFKKREQIKVHIKMLLMYSGIFLLLVSPWLIKNAVWYGNPVFPLLTGIWGGGGWTAIETARFDAGHAPPGHSVGGIFQQIGLLGFYGKWVSALAVVLIPGSLFVSPKKGLLALYGYILFSFICWYAFTHQQVRFMFPAFAVLCICSGMGAAALRERYPRFGYTIIIGGMLYGLLAAAVFYVQSLPDWKVTDNGLREERMLMQSPSYIMADYVNTVSAADERILLIGEAQTFYLQREAVYATVFDRKWIQELVNQSSSIEEIHTALIDHEISRVYIDWHELARFSLTYGDYLEPFNWDLFEAFLASQCLMESAGGRSLADIINQPVSPIEAAQIPYLKAALRRKKQGQRYAYEMYKVKQIHD